ncbi:MAG: HAD hydrolase-like protein [Verrucomicrobia bacterium]|nr:MAG: HAD hydrolase-like protein [Verrucomicrobiota bacterium]
MVQAILFDIDGTLIRTGGAGVAAFARASALAFGKPGGTRDLVFHGRTDTGLVREFLRLHGFSEGAANVRRFLDTYLFLLSDQLDRHHGEICPGVLEFMAGLESLPEPPLLGLLTGNVRLGAELKLRAHGLWEWFEVGGFGDDHEDRDRIAGIAKRRVERRLGRALAGRDVVVVGDTPLDVRCARAIGARCLAVATGGVPASELASHAPDWLVADLGGFSPATFCTRQ